jgi:outer membrane lipoprotein SlyB
MKKIGALMRKVLLLICVLGTSCTSWAQSNPASWENLNTLHAGEKIQVLEMNSKKVSGTFLNVSDAAISVQEEAGSQTIQRQDVRSVKLMKNKHRLRNTLIGAGVGASVGAVMGAATSDNFFGRGFGAAIGAVVVLLPGAVVGALVPSHETIYRVSSH